MSPKDGQLHSIFALVYAQINGRSMPPVIRRYAIIWRLSSAIVYNVVERRDMFSSLLPPVSCPRFCNYVDADIRNGKHKYVYSALLYTSFVAHEAILVQ